MTKRDPNLPEFSSNPVRLFTYSQKRSFHFELRAALAADDERQRYQLLRYGWDKEKYVFNVSIHIDVINGKVWIQRNTTEEEIVDYLAQHSGSVQ